MCIFKSKKQKEKFMASQTPCYLMLIIAVLAVAIIIGSVAGVWYFKAVLQPMRVLEANQQVLLDKIDKLENGATEDAVVDEEELTPLAPEDKVPAPEEVIYEGDGFSYTVPEGYIADEQGLWTKDRYDRHLKNIANDTPSSFPYPDIMIESIDSTDSLESFIADYYKIDDFNYADYDKDGPRGELMWMEKTNLNSYEAMIVSNNEHIGTNTYFVKNTDNNKIYVFTAYKEMVPYIFFVDFISTLKFN